MEWRDISTAPKDGTRVLIWLRDPWNEMRIARFYALWSVWLLDTEPTPQDPREDYYGTGSKIPIYWMPLPEPPVTK